MTRVLRRAVVLAARVAVLLVLIEGLASIALTCGELRRDAKAPLAERQHTRYDPELGWVSIPDASLLDLYGPGVFLRTNSRGFRGARETTPEVPLGRRRVVCSGDSFTLGYGVDDNQTWCARLGVLLPGVETVNLGQGGYGIDQSYLLFRRELPRLAHDVHLFAFITEDFLRMESKEFLGYGKPVLRLGAGGALEVDNVPVPRGAFAVPWLAQNARFVAALRTFQLAQAWLPRRARRAPSADMSVLALRVFGELARLADERHAALVLVHLPMFEELDPGPWDDLRAWLEEEASRRGLVYVDLLPELRGISRASAERLFLARGQLDYPAADGHYGVEGNARVAELLRERLLRLPAARDRLGAPAP